MSTHYTNITLYGVTQDEAVDFCKAQGITAYVSPTIADVTVLYENTLAENAALDAPLEPLLGRAALASQMLMCPALLAMVADDDLFMYVLFMDGAMQDSFMSYSEKPPVNGKPELLADIFDAEDDLPRIRAALTRQMLSATDRHTELMDALMLPPMMVDMGFAYLEEGEKPYGVEDNNAVVFVGPGQD